MRNKIALEEHFAIDLTIEQSRIYAPGDVWARTMVRLDEARESVLKKAYQRANATGNFKLGLATVKQDLNAKVISLDREKFEFDAVAACRKNLPALRSIRNRRSPHRDRR